MPREIDKSFVTPDWSGGKDWPVQKLEDDTTFHIGQCYDKLAATTLSCKNCGNKEFNVGVGGHFTAIRCPKCEWEICIHDG